MIFIKFNFWIKKNYLFLGDLQEDGDIVVSSNCILNPLASNLSSQSSFSARSHSVGELSTELAHNQSLSASKSFTTPALCCIVCGDASSGKHVNIYLNWKLII